ncbi:DUF4214 domain-containing protein [Methylobacterium sp. sgz302541]|uniref:DUF4214 domain-containing protein n=1 Tax=unclassified Methylobacterium TaxID=2615210 RepID=UPI003D34BB18
MASPYEAPSVQVTLDLANLSPFDPTLYTTLQDAIAKFSSGSGSTPTVQVQNVVLGDVPTAPVVNVDTTSGGDVSSVTPSTIINLQGSGTVSGTIGGGDHVVVTGSTQSSLAFTNAGTNYVSTGTGTTTLGMFGSGPSTVVAGSGDLTVTLGNTANTVDLTNGGKATVQSGYGSDTVTLGKSSATVDTGGGFDVVKLSTTPQSVTLNSSGDIVVTDSDGTVSTIRNAEIVQNADGSTIVRATTADQAAVSRMYEALFDRTADADGMANWFAALSRGVSVDSIASQFLNSDEAAAHGFGSAQSDAAFVQNLYATFFNRAPDAGGLAYWEGSLANGTSRAEVLLGFVHSFEGAGTTATTTLVSTVAGSTDTTPHTFSIVPDGSQTVMGGAGFDVVNFTGSKGDFQASFDGETTVLFDANPSSTTVLKDAEYIRFSDGGLIINANTADQATIARLYDGILGRDADSAGLHFWWNMNDSGTSLSSIATSLLSSPEFTASHSSLSSTDFVGLLYQNLLGRTGSNSELAVYASQIDSGTASRADIAVSIAQAGEAQVHNADTIHVVYTP